MIESKGLSTEKHGKTLLVIDIMKVLEGYANGLVDGDIVRLLPGEVIFTLDEAIERLMEIAERAND